MADEPKELTPEEQEIAAAMAKGRWLSIQIYNQLGFLQMFNGPIENEHLMFAMAFLFAGMLAAVDGQLTDDERAGGQLLNDDKRIEHFGDQVREFAKEFRETRAKEKEAKKEASEPERTEPPNYVHNPAVDAPTKSKKYKKGLH